MFYCLQPIFPTIDQHLCCCDFLRLNTPWFLQHLQGLLEECEALLLQVSLLYLHKEPVELLPSFSDERTCSLNETFQFSICFLCQFQIMLKVLQSWCWITCWHPWQWRQKHDSLSSMNNRQLHDRPSTYHCLWACGVCAEWVAFCPQIGQNQATSESLWRWNPLGDLELCLLPRQVLGLAQGQRLVANRSTQWVDWNVKCHQRRLD